MEKEGRRKKEGGRGRRGGRQEEGEGGEEKERRKRRKRRGGRGKLSCILTFEVCIRGHLKDTPLRLQLMHRHTWQPTYTHKHCTVKLQGSISYVFQLNLLHSQHLY